MPDVDIEIAKVTAELELARLRAAAELARGRKWIAAVRPIWDQLELRAALQIAKTFPQAEVFHDARVVGLELPDGTYRDLQVRRGGLDLPIRQWDVLVLEWQGADRTVVANAQPTELKSGGARVAGHSGPIGGSVAGGLSNDAIVAAFRPSSDVGRKLRKDGRLRGMRGRLVVLARNVLTGELRAIRIPTKVIQQTAVTSYDAVIDAVRGTTVTGRGTAGVAGGPVGAAAGRPARGPAAVGGPDGSAGRGTGARGTPRRGPAVRTRRPAQALLARHRQRAKRAAVARKLRSTPVGLTRGARLRGAARMAGRGAVGLVKGLLADIVVSVIVGWLLEKISPEKERIAAIVEAKVPDIEDALAAAYLKHEQAMRRVSERNPAARFRYVLTLGYQVRFGQDFTAGEETLEAIWISGEKDLPEVTITDGPVATGSPDPYTEVLAIDVDFVNLWALPIGGRWRMGRVGRQGLVTEEPAFIDFAVSQSKGTAAVVAVRTRPGQRPDAGVSAIARDVRWDAEALTLDFSYALPHPLFPDDEFGYAVSVVLTESHLFEGLVQPPWEGGEPWDVVLRRVSDPAGRPILGVAG